MQYLVGVCIPDSAEQAWIGERSLESVILLDKTGGELREISVENLETAALELRERMLSPREPA